MENEDYDGGLAAAADGYAIPHSGYSSFLENPATGATGSANVSATASHSSGLGTPRRRMSSFFSKTNRVVLSYEALADNVSADEVLGAILAAVPLPEVPLRERRPRSEHAAPRLRNDA